MEAKLRNPFLSQHEIDKQCLRLLEYSKTIALNGLFLEEALRVVPIENKSSYDVLVALTSQRIEVDQHHLHHWKLFDPPHNINPLLN